MIAALAFLYCLAFVLVILCIGAVNRRVESQAMRRRILRGGMLLALFSPLAFVWIVIVALWHAIRRTVRSA